MLRGVKVNCLKVLKVVGVSVLGAIALAGCAAKGPLDQSGNPLTENQLGGYAVAEVEIKKGFNAQSLAMIDGTSVHQFCNMCFLQEINLKPGEHTVVVNIEINASHQLVQKSFTFSVEAGNRYTLSHGQILVTRRDDPSRLLYTLVPIGGGDPSAYYPPAMIAQHAESVQMQRAEAEAQRIRNQPLVRKIGAHICKEQGAVVYAGYVEQIAEDKVQIRVSSAVMKQNRFVSPAGFQPGIIWDNPSNWDLCE